MYSVRSRKEIKQPTSQVSQLQSLWTREVGAPGTGLTWASFISRYLLSTGHVPGRSLGVSVNKTGRANTVAGVHSAGIDVQ